jgi:hypothetical protein
MRRLWDVRQFGQGAEMYLFGRRRFICDEASEVLDIDFFVPRRDAVCIWII